MVSLSNNWITEGQIDFEYKKYIALAYIKQISDSFSENKLYPHLSELLQHYRSLIEIKTNAQKIEFGGHKTIGTIDLANKKIVYESNLILSEIFDEVNKIIDFSIPLFYQTICNGKELFLELESSLTMQSIGIRPLNTDEGYLILQNKELNLLHVFNYSLSFYEAVEGNSRLLYTRYIDSFKTNLNWNPESTKQYLLEKYHHLPNPAVFYFESKKSLPFNETYLPLVKRYLVSKLAA